MTASQQAQHQGFRAGMLKAALINIFILTKDQGFAYNEETAAHDNKAIKN